MEVRPAVAADLPSVQRIALLTGDAGRDASARFADPTLVAAVWAAPYLALEPEHCVVLAAGGAVLGYAVGTTDTAGFADRLERDWWPPLRARHPDPGPAPETADQTYARLIHHPPQTPPALVGAFPAHLHLNLLPEARGGGHGRRLFEAWLTAAGHPAAHVGVSAGNPGGLAFWTACGFAPPPKALVPGQGGAIWLCRPRTSKFTQ